MQIGKLTSGHLSPSHQQSNPRPYDKEGEKSKTHSSDFTHIHSHSWAIAMTLCLSSPHIGENLSSLKFNLSLSVIGIASETLTCMRYTQEDTGHHYTYYVCIMQYDGCVVSPGLGVCCRGFWWPSGGHLALLLYSVAMNEHTQYVLEVWVCVCVCVLPSCPMPKCSYSHSSMQHTPTCTHIHYIG